MPPGAARSPRALLRRRAARRARRRRRSLTLYCRMDLSPTAQVTASSSPTPGDARGALLGRAPSTPRRSCPSPYSSEGPTDDGRLKPDIAAPTNVLITPGDPESEAINSCGGTSCATPHVGGAAALIWGEVAADGGPGSVAQRVRDRLVAQALDIGAPGAGHGLRRRAGCGSTSRAPVLGTPQPAPDALVRGTVALSLPLADEGTLGLMQLTADGAPLVATLAPGGILQADLADRRARPGPARPRRSPPPTRAATSPPTRSRCASTTTRRACACAAPPRARAGDKVRISASVLDAGQRPRGPAAHRVRRRRGRLRLPPRAPLRARRAATSCRSRATDRAGNTRSCGGRCTCACPRRGGGRRSDAG